MSRSHTIWASALLAILSAAPARAAELQEVADYGAIGVPDYVDMFIYVPDTLADNPPILVASHFCGGNASVFSSILSGSIGAAADEHGFIVIFPQATGRTCFDIGSTESLSHDGGGDTQAIVQMVRYALDTNDGDPTRVYAMGISGGAMMTQALLAVYPDVFAAGAELSGVPAGCWADAYDPNGQWSSTCAAGTVNKTAEQWGDGVRAMYPSYTGHRPRIQLWHGSADDVINYNNFGEAIEEWTDVLSLDAAPDTTEALANDFTRQRWQSDCGDTVLETWSQQNGTHDVPVMADTIIGFFGLDVAGPDPQDATCGVDAGTGGDDAGMMIEGEPDAGSPPLGGAGGTGGASDAGGAGGSDAIPPSGGAGGSAGTSPDPQVDDGGVAGSGAPAGDSSSSGCAVTTRRAPAPAAATMLACIALATLWRRRR